MTVATETKKAECMWCHGHCPVSVIVRDGRLVGLQEYQEHPQAKEVARIVRSCPKARAVAEWFYHPDRLNYPLKRAGERGEGKWQRISWDQALDEVAAKLKAIKSKYGPEAVGATKGTFRTHEEFQARFMNIFGSPNIVDAASLVCYAPANMVSCFTVGFLANRSRPSPKTRCVFVMGANWEQSWRPQWFSILDAQKRGARLIVADPRETELAKRADIWLQHRPGTDTALLLSLIHVVISENLYDKEFVSRWCYGFDKLSQRAAQYPPEKAAEITWVPAEKIRAAARMYAANRPGIFNSKMGMEHIYNSIEALHARYILPAIVGNIDVEGGDLLTGLLHQGTVYEAEAADHLSPEQRQKLIGCDRFKLHAHEGFELIEESVQKIWGTAMARYGNVFAHSPSFYRAIITGQPYPVKALLTMSSNPMLTAPGTKTVYKALKALELYAVIDFFLTPSADLADYVFPAASWLERPSICWGPNPDSLEGSEAALPPQYERRTDYEFWRGLGIRLGQKKYWPWPTLEEALDARIAPLGLTLKDLARKKSGAGLGDALKFPEKKYLKTGFATPTGKVELYSTILEKLGYDPLPQFHEPPESPVSSPDLAQQYPLILITGGRFKQTYHSEHRQVDSLRQQHPYPVLQVNPKAAAGLGLAEGDWAWIETPRGRVKQKVQLFSGIDPRVVHAEHGWWFPELPGEEPWLHGVWESNINVVTDDDPDHCNPISGGWPLRGELCRVYKVKQF